MIRAAEASAQYKGPPEGAACRVRGRLAPCRPILAVALLLSVIGVPARAQQLPEITITPLSGTRGGDITIEYLIADAGSDPVGLLVEYATGAGGPWLVATVTGDTSDIVATDYDSSMVWNSKSDLDGQALELVWLRITPHDAGGWGTTDTIDFPLDNKPPAWIAATGSSGDTTITFWFDEPVEAATATNLSNINLSDGLTAGAITACKWTTGSSMGIPRRGSACAVIDDKLYVVGGTGAGSWDDEALEVYDPATDTWTTRAPISDGRTGAAAGAISGKLYVSGGGSGITGIFDPETNSWSTGYYWSAYEWASAGVINGKFYRAGGYWSGSTTSAVWVYDPLLDSWNNRSAMNTARCGAAAGVINGRFYVAGGENGGIYLSDLEVYDPASDTWTPLAPMPSPVGYAAAGVIHGRLFVAGGYDGSDFSSHLYAYDPATDRWSIEAQIPTLRYECTAGVIDDKLYVVSGYRGGYIPQVEVYDPRIGYVLTLSSGQVLPLPETTVTITASNISDWYGNTIPAPIHTSFIPITGSVPVIVLSPMEGTHSGDITISYEISDLEGNPISLRTEYSIDDAASWQSASVSGNTSGIYSDQYRGSLVWQSRTDLAQQVLSRVWFRITPRDNGTTEGVPDSVSCGLDNKPPAWIEAEGAAGESSFTFWFDEPVQDATATNISNISLSNELTIDNVTVLDTLMIAASMPTAREVAAAGVIDGKLYVVGGWGNNTAYSMLEVYDPASDTWTTRAPIPSARHSANGAVHDGRLYVTGGNLLGGAFTNTAWVYDSATNTWNSLTSMPDWKSRAASAFINGRLYVAGGRGATEYSSCYEYDPATDTWVTKAPMNVGRYGTAVGVIDGKLYVAGGCSGHVASPVAQSTLEVYDPSTDTWTTLQSIPQAMGEIVGGVINGKLYVASAPTSGTIYAYDPGTDTWSTASAIASPREGTVGGVLGGKFYITGGSGSGYQTTLEVYDPQFRFESHLTSGQVLLSPEAPVTITAANISDWYGNTIPSLSTNFTPTTGAVPSITLLGISETVSGDIPVQFQISDTEHNPVSLSAEYSTDGTTWLTASVLGNLSSIYYSSYQDTLTWRSRTDLAGQQFDQVWFKVTPRDNETTPGIPDSISFALDNKPPEWMATYGLVGNTSFEFWFDELVDLVSTTNPANTSLTSGLTPASITHAGIDTWTIRSPMPTAREFASVGVIDGSLYVVGGFSGTSYLNTLEVYDSTTDTWISKTPMLTVRGNAAAGVINGKLYVVGGYDGFNYLNTLEVYDPVSDTWTSGAAMPSARHHSTAGVIGGKLYVVGGYNGTNLDILEVYDPSTDSWTTNSPAPTARRLSASGEINGNLYIVDGFNNSGYLNTLEVYYPTSDTWSTKAPSPTARYAVASGVIDGKLYVVGGEYGSGRLNLLEVYDPVADSWMTQSPMPTGRRSLSAGVIRGSLYVTGGYDGTDDTGTLEVYTAWPDRFVCNLSSGQTLPFATLTLTANNIADLYGNVAPELTLDWVPQDTNSDPTITVYDIPDEVSGDVTISYLIADAEGDLIRIEPEYSIDAGTSWLPPAVVGTLVDIGPSNYSGSLLWHAAQDLPGYDLPGVLFRITTFDNTIETGGSDQITFHLDNNLVPEIVITDAVYSRADSLWTFSYTLTDAEDDTLKLVAQYSLDGGSSLLAATIEGRGDTLLPGDYVNQIIWRSEIDIPQTVQELIFSLTPWDHDPGMPATQQLLHNALGLPTTQLTWSWSGEQSGDIAFDYVADDVDLEALTLYFDYHHPDGNWYYATITGGAVVHAPQQITLSGPSVYSGSFVWHSADDLPGLDLEAVEFRVRPWDATQEGIGTTVSLHLDNNVPPTVTVGTPSGTVSRNVTIPVTLSDAEGDTLRYNIEYSLDAGSGVWLPATVTTSIVDILPGGYAHNVIWDSMADLGYMHSDQVTIRVVPFDHDIGPNAFTGTFSLANYVGDYTGDIAVDFADFATLVSAWNTQDTYHDIGPATGTVPDLVPVYDGKIDFEDLAVYAMMWTWSDANPPAAAARVVVAPVSTRAAGRKAAEKDDHPVRLEQPMPDDPWAPDDGILELRFQASGVSGLTSAGLTLEYDTRFLRLREVVPGPMLGTTGGAKPSLVQLKRVNEEEGRIELLLGRIDPERPSIYGSGMLAVARFEKLSREDSVVRVTYDLRDRRAEAIAAGDYERSVQATLRPTEFALLQNYPNPFNGETVIRFQLPTEQRVQIQLYNMRGQLVTTLLDERREAGYHRVSWNGRDAAGRPVASGIYIYLIQAGTHRESKKLVILK